MGYYEVLNWLVNRRADGDESYFTTSQIAKQLMDNGKSDNGISGICVKLEFDGYVEARMSMDIKNWQRQYRATQKAVRARYG